MKKTVLITGAAGFLGSHLCDYFLSKDYKVIGLDNLITGSLKNVSHIKSNSNFDELQKDANNSDKYLFFMTISLIYSFLIHFYILRVCKSTITLIFVKDQ